MNVDPDLQEVAEAVVHEQLQGWVPPVATPAELHDALEKAFDYRGDITITLKDSRSFEAYIFDRRPAESIVRVMTKEGEKISIRYNEIAALNFTGRDTAAGKSWEAWVRKYWEKQNAGEKFDLEPESLD
jgi:transcriptional antiterminator Rof (Rho-off)